MIENEDYYIENGYYVFTEKYHLKRGYCCKSGCRHCPWNYKKEDTIDYSSPASPGENTTNSGD